MVTETLSPTPKQQFLDNNGNPAALYRLFTYSGGTATKATTYTDSTGVTPNANPITLDFRGECNLWIPPNTSYKYVYCAPGSDDPPTTSIWTVDSVVNAQLLTLYGGVDTGAGNAYVLNFTAQFTSYTDGIVIYWVPSHTNTGASTINVNGLGVVPITNVDGTALTANQIVANQFAVIICKGGAFVLQYQFLITGTFTGTIATGLTTTPNRSFTYYSSQGFISLGMTSGTTNFTGVSNSTGMTITGIPAEICSRSTLPICACYMIIDNGVTKTGTCYISGGTIGFGLGFDGSTLFTAAGTKGLEKNFRLFYSIY